MSKQFTFDEIVLYLNSEQWKPNICRLVMAGLLYAVGGTLGIVLKLDMLGFFSTLICGLYISVIIIRMGILSIKKDQIRESTDRLAQNVPIRFLIRAHNTIEYKWAAISAVECYESHVPGDCPLCGAK